MHSSKPFLSPETIPSDDVCIICNGGFTKKQKQLKLGEKCWLNFKRSAEIRASIDIPTNEPMHRFTDVYECVRESDTAFGYVHDNCRLEFSNEDIFQAQRIESRWRTKPFKSPE